MHIDPPLSIYLSGPILGCSEEEIWSWRNKAADLLSGYDVVDVAKLHLGDPDCVGKDLEQLELCDILLAFPWKYSAGCSMEICYAFNDGTEVVTVANNDISPWIRHHSTVLVKTFEEAANWIKQFEYEDFDGDNYN